MNYCLVQDVFHYCHISPRTCSAMPTKEIDFFDLTFVLSGSMVYTADGETYLLKKNDAVFLRPGILRARSEGTEPVEYVSFNFHLCPGKDLPFAPYLPNCISGSIRRLISAFPKSHLSDRYHAEEKAANMLNYILFELMDTTAFPSTNEHISRIIHLVEDRLTEKLTLQDISREIGLTKEYISHIFKKEMNKTLTDYINERKMLLAKELIYAESMRLTDLSAYLGYENYSYFSTLFKRYFQVTPIQFKKES